MGDVEVAALLTCAAFPTLLWVLKPPVSPFSPMWIVVVGLVCFKSELWTTVADLAVRTPWSGIICISSILLYTVLRSGEFPRSEQQRFETKDFESRSDQGANEGFLKPLLLPARTTHTRLFPKKHSFSYSYLLVGIPVGWRGVVSSFLSADLPLEYLPHSSIFQKLWFSISAADYLERGGGHLGLQGKLQSYLMSQVR